MFFGFMNDWFIDNWLKLAVAADAAGDVYGFANIPLFNALK
jgi:hypothetical protein